MLIREILEEVAPLMIGMLFQRLRYIGCLLPAFGSPRKPIRQRIASKNEAFVDPMPISCHRVPRSAHHANSRTYNRLRTPHVALDHMAGYEFEQPIWATSAHNKAIIMSYYYADAVILTSY